MEQNIDYEGLPKAEDIGRIRKMLSCLESPSRRLILSILMDGKRHKFVRLAEACENTMENPPKHIYSDIGTHLRYMLKVGLVEKHDKRKNSVKGAYYSLDPNKIKEINLFINTSNL